MSSVCAVSPGSLDVQRGVTAGLLLLDAYNDANFPVFALKLAGWKSAAGGGGRELSHLPVHLTDGCNRGQSLTWAQGHKHLGHCPLLSQAHPQGAGLDVGRPGLEPTSM